MTDREREAQIRDGEVLDREEVKHALGWIESHDRVDGGVADCGICTGHLHDLRATDADLRAEIDHLREIEDAARPFFRDEGEYGRSVAELIEKLARDHLGELGRTLIEQNIARLRTALEADPHTEEPPYGEGDCTCSTCEVHGPGCRQWEPGCPVHGDLRHQRDHLDRALNDGEDDAQQQ